MGQSDLKLKKCIILVTLIMGALVSLSLINRGGLLKWGLNFQSDYLSQVLVAYNKLTLYGPSHGSVYSINEVSTDEMVIPQKGGDWFDNGQWVRLHQHTYAPTDFEFNDAWSQIYDAISTCNRLLFQFSKISAPDKDIYEAEVRVLRAFYYYLLLDAFGNVPIINDYFPSNPGIPTMNTRQELYDFIVAEIQSGLPNLSIPPVYGRLNQSGARSLLAKLYINSQVYTGSPGWMETIDECNVIINSGFYDLQNDYYENFYITNDTVSEIIFQIPYEDGVLNGFNIGQMTLHYQSQATFGLAQQPWNGYSSLESFYNSFDASDVRRDQFLVGPQTDTSGNPITDPAFDDPGGAQVDFTPFINELQPNAYRDAGARVYKWKYEIGGDANMNHDFGIFRFADILLMKAEASFRIGDSPTAMALINQIRSRAGVAPLATVTLTDILAERGWELFAEGWRRQDLIRFGVYNDPWWEKLASTTDKNIFPIPQEQVNINPNLMQNPGY